MRFDMKRRYMPHGVDYMLTQDGKHVCHFREGPETSAKERSKAWRAFIDGMARAGHSVFDVDNNQFLCGDMKEIVDHDEARAAAIRAGVS